MKKWRCVCSCSKLSTKWFNGHIDVTTASLATKRAHGIHWTADWRGITSVDGRDTILGRQAVTSCLCWLHRWRTCNVTLRRVRETIVAVEKQYVLHILCVCVCVLLIIQRPRHLRRIRLPTVACPAVLYFSILSHKRHDFWDRAIEHNMWLWFSLQLVCEIFHISRIIQWRINVKTSSYKVPVILVRF